MVEHGITKLVSQNFINDFHVEKSNNCVPYAISINKYPRDIYISSALSSLDVLRFCCPRQRKLFLLPKTV